MGSLRCGRIGHRLGFLFVSPGIGLLPLKSVSTIIPSPFVLLILVIILLGHLSSSLLHHHSPFLVMGSKRESPVR